MRQPTGDNTLAGYVRQSSADITPTATLRAAPINAEYNKLRDAFAVSSGHKHDGSTGEGGYVSLIADVDALNKIVVNTSTNQIGVFVQVSSSTVEQLRFSDGAIIPVTDNDIDLGTASLEFKDLYLDGTAHIDTLDVDINGAVAGTFTIGSTLGVTGTTTLSTANITTGVITSVDINSGAIDNVTIGGTTAGAGSFTTLNASGTSTLATVDIGAGAIDGTIIGANTAAAATVTALTASGTSTLSTVDINAGNIDGTTIGASSAAAGSFTTVVTSGQATLATVDINGGNIDGAIIGASATAAITGTTITGSSLVGPLTGNVSGNTAGVHTGNVTGNVTGNITASSGTSTLNNLTVNGTLDVTGTTIANVTDPTNAQDAATKNYVDTEVSALVDSSPAALNTLNELAAAINDDASFSTTITNSIATKLPLAGGTMSGAIAMGTSKITGLGDPTANQDGATKNYVDTTALLKSGGTMASAIAMGSNKITGLGTPTANTDAATKTYVDSIAGSNTAAAASATEAATSATNAATSATNSSNSATAAATSATNAANSYDSFDDRYLGAKSSAPTVDNDGDALITGALYFNTTSNIMFVRSSAGGWQAAGSSVNGTSGRNTYTATSGQTTFSATYDVGYVDVFLNGVKLLVGTDVVATSGSTVVLSTGATVGDIVDIVGYGTFQLADHYSKTASDARFLGLAGGTMTGDIDGNGNKVLFGNVYSQVSDLPSASTYHGMFAHVHATGKGYFAHAGNWVVLANDTEKLNLSGGTMTGNLDVGGSVEFDSLSGTGSVSITDILDEDNMASNSATALATQQSIKAYTDTAVANLVASSPASLDTLNELAAALGDDASFSTTITDSIATKLPLAGGTLTGNLNVGGTVTADGLTVDGDGKITTSSGIGLQLHNSSSNQSYLQFTNSATGESSANGFQIGIDGSEEGLIWHYKNEPIKFATNNTEAMRIDSSGNVGILNSVASTIASANSRNGLVVGSGSGNNGVTLYSGNTSNSSIMFADGTAGATTYIGQINYDHNADAMSFATTATEAMRIDSSGVVRIGGQTGTLKLGNDATYHADIEWEYNNSELAFTTNDVGNFTFNSNGSERMRITSSGNVGINTSSPDAMLTVDTNVGGSSTGTLARFHASKGESDSTFLQIAATRHGTASVQRVQLQAFDDDGSTGRTLALNPSGGSVGIGLNDPSARLEIGGMAAGEQALLIESGRNDALSNGLARINITDSNCPFAGLQIDHAGTGAAIIANGNVGIGGTPDSGRKLHIEGGDATVGITLKDTAGGQFGINSDGGNLIFKSDSANSERLRITSNGRQAYNGSANANGHANFVGEVGSSSKAILFEHTVGGGEVGSIRTTSSTAVYYGDGSNLTGVGGSTTLGAVGTYAFLSFRSATLGAGTTKSGSDLDWANTGTYGFYDGGTQPTGTWRLMGVIGYYVGSASANDSLDASVWVRIS